MMTRTAIVEPSKPIVLYLPWDPAFSPNEAQAKCYSKTMRAEDLGPANGKATGFHVLPLGLAMHEVWELLSEGRGERAHLLAFDLGCKRITDFGLEDGTCGCLPRSQWNDYYLHPQARAYIGALIIKLSVGPVEADAIPLP